ncbi:MAG: phosphoribosylanthranilate isomerase [Calditrichia bacterium]
MTKNASLIPHPLIQVAGVCDEEEMQLLLANDVDWLGIPLRLPVNREDLSEEAATKLFDYLADRAVLITYLKKATEIIEFCHDMGAHRVQLHGDIATEELNILRTNAADLYLIKSLVVKTGNRKELRKQLLELEGLVDCFITDTHDPVTGADGATGKTHDWQISRMLVEASSKPVVLAGGLNPVNVGEAIRIVKPAGVDVHTGVEGPDGRKSVALVRRFVREARSAFSRL